MLRNPVLLIMSVGLLLTPELVTIPAFAQVNTSKFERFVDWCDNRERLTPAAQHTVQVLLTQSRREDCDEAQLFLENQDLLQLNSSGIEDLSPLTSFPHLQFLVLHGN